MRDSEPGDEKPRSPPPRDARPPAPATAGCRLGELGLVEGFQGRVVQLRVGEVGACEEGGGVVARRRPRRRLPSQPRPPCGGS